MMRQMLLLLAWGMSAAAWADDPLPFPAMLGEFEHNAFQDYEKDSPGLGYANNYSGTNAVATVYLYTRSLSVPAAANDPFFAEELARSRTEFEQFAAQQGYEEMQMARYGEFASAGGYPCLSMLAGYVENGAPRVTMTCVMPFNQQILKVRYTFVPVLNSDDQGPRLAAFLSALAQFLKQHETASGGPGPDA
jgi:hypothetical protein